MMPEQIAAALGRASRKADGGYMAQCPCHDDDKASLSIDYKDGKLLVKCFAGCEQNEIIAALKARGLWPEQHQQTVKREIAAVYDYVTADGELLFQSLRYIPKDFRQRRPDGNGGWTYNLHGVQPVPFNLPEVITAKWCAIVEGEKDVLNLKKIGVPASCNPAGAGKWKQEYNEFFAGKKIVILPDNDGPGRKHAQQVAQHLYGVGTEVRIVELPDLPPKGDVSDWLAAGNDKNDLLEIIKSAPVWSPELLYDASQELSGCDPALDMGDSPVFDLSLLVTGADIAAGDYEVSFLVDRLIPENSITLFYAKGGSGKSTLATQIAAAVNTGIHFMGLATLQRPVVVLDYENPKAVLKKRINAIQGADGVYFWAGQEMPQLNTTAWSDLKSLVHTLPNPLLIVDTLSSSCNGLDISKNSDFSPVMARIIELRNMGATVVLLHHTPKNDETKYIGASCIYNQCDHILAMYPVRQSGTEQEATDDDDAKVYRLGTKDKSRFEHYHIFVEFDDCSGTFVKAPDPSQEFIDTLLRFITEQPGITQTEILSKIGPKNKIRSLLKNHEGVLWRSEKGAKNTSHYYSISVCQFAAPYRAGKQENRNQFAGIGWKTESDNSQQSAMNTEFASFSKVSGQTEKLDEMPDFDLEVLQ